MYRRDAQCWIPYRPSPRSLKTLSKKSERLAEKRAELAVSYQQNSWQHFNPRGCKHSHRFYSWNTFGKAQNWQTADIFESPWKSSQRLVWGKQRGNLRTAYEEDINYLEKGAFRFIFRNLLAQASKDQEWVGWNDMSVCRHRRHQGLLWKFKCTAQRKGSVSYAQCRQSIHPKPLVCINGTDELPTIEEIPKAIKELKRTKWTNLHALIIGRLLCSPSQKKAWQWFSKIDEYPPSLKNTFQKTSVVSELTEAPRTWCSKRSARCKTGDCWSDKSIRQVNRGVMSSKISEQDQLGQFRCSNELSETLPITNGEK